MKYIKDNSYIIVGTLLVLALSAIIINSVYAGIQHYKLKGEPHMYGLMYVAPDGKKEYLTNTNYGHTSEDITQIAEMVQYKTAEAQAKALLKRGWLEAEGGEIYVIEVVKLPVNPVQITIPKPKAGYVIQQQANPSYKIEYYQGPKNRDYYRTYDFDDCKTPATRFKSENEALKLIERLIADLRETQDEEYKRHMKQRPNSQYSNDFCTIIERNDFLISTFKVVKFDEGS